MRSITKRTTSLLLNLQYNYTPVSNFEIQNKVNPIVAITLGYQRHSLDLHFRLFENVVPKTTENFKRLLLGTAQFNGRPLSLLDNRVHHIIPRSYAELGHLADGNCSIFGPKFRDQSFQLPHDRPGLLSCVSQENTCNSRFLITYAPCPFLDLKNVVFGEVTAETFQNLRSLQKMGSKAENFKILETKLVEVQAEEHHH